MGQKYHPGGNCSSVDRLAEHLVFCTWGAEGHRGTMPDFLSYFAKNKIVGKDLASVEKV